MRIRVLVTGGTFDKQYDELTGRLFFRDTHVPEMLSRGRCRLDVTVETVMMIDSLDLDDAGRQAIVTPVTPAGEFWPAEEYHQDYYRKNPVQYRFYVTGCGRYARLDQLWGPLRAK